MRKIAVVGAGKTGRGFIGRLLGEAGQEILFIDRNVELVSALNEAGKFCVDFFGNEREPLEVGRFRACTWEDVSLKDVELIFVSVGGQNLPEAGKSLAACLDGGRHYYVITCENASHPSGTLRKAMGKDNISVSEATVFCTTIEGHGLDIHSENYPYLQCDADLLDGYVPEIKQVRPMGQFAHFLTRKLYTYNAASCVIAYLGWAKGYTNYGDAANDKEILEMLDRNYAATNRVLCREYGYEEKDQEEFALLSKKKFCDRTIADTVSRNARDPQRKLAASERIMGPIRLLYKYGEDASVLEKTAAAAILYQAEPDDPWSRIQSEKTREQILKEICKVDPEEPVFAHIMGYIREMERNISGTGEPDRTAHENLLREVRKNV
jgi:mannitol-1-phosphate 5-dehydrogenase